MKQGCGSARELTLTASWQKAPFAFQASAAAPAAGRGGAAEARSAEASYVPVTRKVSLTDEKKHSLAKV